VQTAIFAGPVQLDLTAALTLRDVALKGVYCYPVTSWPRVIRMIASGRLPVERIVTGRIDLDDIVPRGFEALMDPQGSHVKVLVRV
jgi:(R,R)-butanediol dehydrogenase/meso-butanediol dehydrogenase/diacetyl reductase